MDDRVRRVRFHLGTLRRRSAPKCWGLARVTRGAGVGVLAKALGRLPGTITRWPGRTHRRPLRRITINPGLAAVEAPPSPPGLLPVTPQGWRVEGHGLCIYAKRLEQAHFAGLWRDAQAATLTLTMGELQLFREGSALVGRLALSPVPFVLRSSRESLHRARAND